MNVSEIAPTIHSNDINALLGAYHWDPFAVLGMHQSGDRLVVRVFRPDARAVTVQDARDPSRRFDAMRVHQDGVFEAVLPENSERFPYVLKFTAHDGHEWIDHDPYSFGQIFGEMDLHLFSEGQHWEIYKKMGAQVTEIGGVPGVSFAVWAPNAERVSVVGAFNEW